MSLSMSMYMPSICLFARLLILLVCLFACCCVCMYVCMRGAVYLLDGWMYVCACTCSASLCLLFLCFHKGEEGKRERKKQQVGPTDTIENFPWHKQAQKRSPVCPLTPLFLSTLCVHLQCGKPFGNPCSHRDTAACHYGSDSASSGVMQP